MLGIKKIKSASHFDNILKHMQHSTVNMDQKVDQVEWFCIFFCFREMQEKTREISDIQLEECKICQGIKTGKSFPVKCSEVMAVGNGMIGNLP